MDSETAAGTVFPIREPGKFRQYVSALGIAYQEYIVYGPKQGTWTRTSTGWNTGVVTAWEKTRVNLPASKTSLLHLVGDSMVENGDNGTIWPSGDQWPAKLSALLPAGAVVNRGQSGSFVDEVLLHTGARPMRLKVTSGSIPATGGTPVELSWPVNVSANKWVSCQGKLRDKAEAAIDRNGTTGAWTIRQISGPEPCHGQQSKRPTPVHGPRPRQPCAALVQAAGPRRHGDHPNNGRHGPHRRRHDPDLRPRHGRCHPHVQGDRRSNGPATRDALDDG